jgi:hypothetical protein
LSRPGFLLSLWPWRSAAYLLSSAPVGIATLIGILVLAGAGGLLSVAVVGLPLLGALGLAGVPGTATRPAY